MSTRWEQQGPAVTQGQQRQHACSRTIQLSCLIQAPECCCPEDRTCSQLTRGAAPLKPVTNPLSTEARDFT